MPELTGNYYGLDWLAMLMSLLFLYYFEWYMLSWSIEIAGPAFFIGILFLMGWFKKKK